MTRAFWPMAFVAALGCSGGEAQTAAPARPHTPHSSKERLPGPELTPDRVALPPVERRLAVPGFEGATAWLNVDHALTPEELRGRVVVIDFWTSCCINCLHTIPTLQALEKTFRGQPLVVVGVHSPKFDEERAIGRLRDVLVDNGIEHPIAVDGDMAIWKAWGITGWPTVVVLDVEGKAIWAGSGEPDGRELEGLVASAIEEGRRGGRLVKGDLRGARAEKGAASTLRYPGKVTSLADGGFAVADTGHHRIVFVDRSGAKAAIVGSGLAGKTDGDFDGASFQRPQGMAEILGDLYVADTGNHLLRKIDRRSGKVTTVAGTGELGLGKLEPNELDARAVALRSPWDLLHRDGTLYVALAGSHQIAAFDPKRGTIRAYAGNGHEARSDGSAMEASFAQPSALATDGKELFVLDSETSSVRAIAFQTGRVRTVVGQDLFVFGDVDGDRNKARLQHPIGMAYGAGALWVADSYNSKIKRVDPSTGSTKTVIGGGDPSALGEPAGLTVSGDALFIADTNHHRIGRWPIKARGREPTLETLTLSGVVAPTVGVALASGSSATQVDARDPVVSLGGVRLAAGRPSQLRVEWRLPEGTGINADAPFRLVWTESHGLARTPPDLRAKGAEVARGFDVALEPAAGKASASLTGVVDVVLCDVATHRVCVPVRRTLRAEIAIESGAPPPRAVIPLPAAK